MSFRTMGEFRHALGQLAKANGRRGRRARRNMAVTAHGKQFDTVAELVEYEKAYGLGPGSASVPSDLFSTRVRKGPVSRSESRREETKTTKRRGPSKEKLEAAFSPPSRQQATLIRKSLGGSLFALCGRNWHEGLDLSEEQIAGHQYPSEFLLMKMGIDTYKKASDLIQALDAAEVLGNNIGKEKAFERDMAREIAVSEHGMVCAGLSSARKNKGRRAKRNSSYMIESSWPRKDYEFGPYPRNAHWTSYPQYAYDQFYRPIDARMPWVGHATANPGPGVIPPSAFPAKPKPWPVADNAGPFVPEMYPFGLEGTPETYALSNRGSRRGRSRRITQRGRERAARSGMTLSGSTSWPVPDVEHALIALRYMAKGRGKRYKYKSYLKKLFSLYPRSEFPEVAKEFKRLRTKIERWV